MVNTSQNNDGVFITFSLFGNGKDFKIKHNMLDLDITA